MSDDARPPHMPVFIPAIGVDTMKYLMDAFHVGWLGMGASTLDFETKIGAYLGVGERRVLATNTGTSALHIALKLAGVGKGDEVIVPSFNFIADHQAVLQCGGVPVLCDVCDDDLGADPAAVEALVTPRTKAILPLHYAGIPCRIDALRAVARKHNLRVVEDATHAFGSVARGRRVGGDGDGDLVCFSFDPVKIITSIDGGAVVLPSAELMPAAQRLRLLGIDKDTVERYKNTRAWEYDVLEEGYRYHLTNINASIGLSQLARIDEFIASRQRACRRYSAALAGVPGLRVPQTDFEGVSPFIYFVRVEAGRRLGLIEALKKRGIATGIHFLPTHKFTIAKEWRRGPMTVTERVCEEVVTLPLHSGMSNETVDRVVEGIRGVLG
jgi:dTDP-4-amino-4,6-dideoxygalactose transaminase